MVSLLDIVLPYGVYNFSYLMMLKGQMETKNFLQGAASFMSTAIRRRRVSNKKKVRHFSG